MNDDITPTTLPDEDGNGAVPSVTETPKVEGLKLEEINSILGKNFTDVETAKKAIKDTFNYVGKKQDDVKEDLTKAGYMTKEEFEKEIFFRDNPDHSKNKDVLEALAKTKGISLREASQHDSYKALYEGATNYEKSQSLKSVLEPNPRLASAMSRGTNVTELAKQGRRDEAGQEAARAVIEALGLDQ